MKREQLSMLLMYGIGICKLHCKDEIQIQGCVQHHNNYEMTEEHLLHISL